MIDHAQRAGQDVVRSDARRAGDVVRYSTWPVLRQQTNGQHTWQVMRILHTIWPDVTAEAMVHALHHDSGELGSGDIPYPFKSHHPELRSIIESLEARSRADQGIVLPPLDDTWRWRIKTCDMVEMFEKGAEEWLLGNRLGVPVMRAMETHIMERLGPDLTEDAVRVSAYLATRWNIIRATEELR